MAIQCFREKVEKSIGVERSYTVRESDSPIPVSILWRANALWSFEGDFERLSTISWNARTVYLVKFTLPISLDIHSTYKRILRT